MNLALVRRFRRRRTPGQQKHGSYGDKRHDFANVLFHCEPPFCFCCRRASCPVLGLRFQTSIACAAVVNQMPVPRRPPQLSSAHVTKHSPNPPWFISAHPPQNGHGSSPTSASTRTGGSAPVVVSVAVVVIALPPAGQAGRWAAYIPCSASPCRPSCSSTSPKSPWNRLPHSLHVP